MFSCRFCELSFRTIRTKQRHEVKEHEDEQSVNKHNKGNTKVVPIGYKRCVSCCVLIKDSKDAFENHKASQIHIIRNSLILSDETFVYDQLKPRHENIHLGTCIQSSREVQLHDAEQNRFTETGHY
jgi:hypothetical protein